MKKIGVVSDTHGLVRASVVEALTGVDAIIHAGDIGSAGVIETLEKIAPLTLIRGNVDKGRWAAQLPDVETVDIEGCSIYIVHNLKEAGLEPGGRFSVVVSGHSHMPKNEVKNGVLYFNPGSAGPRRFRLPIAMGFLEITRGRATGTIVELEE